MNYKRNELDIHPVLSQMKGNDSSDQSKIAVAFQVYMELCEARRMWDVEYHYNPKLKMHYFTAKKSHSSGEAEIFVPISVTAELSPARIEEIQDELCADSGTNSVTFAIKEQDSTVVYYTVTRGLERPDSPETTKRKKARQERQRLVEAEISRQRVTLYEQACGIGGGATEEGGEEGELEL